MKRSKLPQVVIAAMMAGLTIVPTPQAGNAGPATIRDVNAAGQRRDAQPAPVSQANATAQTLQNFLPPPGYDSPVVLAPMWPHNRPLPGWRKVQSRARHAERMRRQRRNA